MAEQFENEYQCNFCGTISELDEDEIIAQEFFCPNCQTVSSIFQSNIISKTNYTDIFKIPFTLGIFSADQIINSRFITQLIFSFTTIFFLGLYLQFKDIAKKVCFAWPLAFFNSCFYNGATLILISSLFIFCSGKIFSGKSSLKNILLTNILSKIHYASTLWVILHTCFLSPEGQYFLFPGAQAILFTFLLLQFLSQ